MIPRKVLAPIVVAVAFVAGAAVALPTVVAGDEPAPPRAPLVLEEATATPDRAEPRVTLRPKPPAGDREDRDDRRGDDLDDTDDRDDDVSDSDDDDDDVEVVRPELDDDDDDDADDDDDDGDDD